MGIVKNTIVADGILLDLNKLIGKYKELWDKILEMDDEYTIEDILDARYECVGKYEWYFFPTRKVCDGEDTCAIKIPKNKIGRGEHFDIVLEKFNKEDKKVYNIVKDFFVNDNNALSTGNFFLVYYT